MKITQQDKEVIRYLMRIEQLRLQCERLEEELKWEKKRRREIYEQLVGERMERRVA